MTAILTFVVADSIIQASDRRVTVRRDSGYQVHDPTANKSIVYFGKNCRLVIGYAGLAYVGDLPTDAWICQQLTGEAVASGVRLTDRPIQLLTIEEVLQLFKERLPGRVDLSIGGFEEAPDRSEPFLWTIRRGMVSQDYDRNGQCAYAHGTMIPTTWADHDDIMALLEDIKTSPPLELHMALVRGIRRLSGKHVQVGSDVMVVELAGERRWISASVYLDHTGGEDKAPLLYSPAILLPQNFMAPSRISPGRFEMVVQREGFSFGPVEDPENDCVVVFNADEADGYGGLEGADRLPPALW